MVKKQAMVILICLFAALGLAFLLPGQDTSASLGSAFARRIEFYSIVGQQITETNSEAKEVLSIYHKDELLGVIHSQQAYQSFLNRIYEEKYREDFPNTEVGLGEDIHVSTSLSYFEYEDKDEEIFAYLEDNNLFSIMGYKIEFSNGTIAYVKDIEDFKKAREDFVLNFLEGDTETAKANYKLLSNGKEISDFSETGRKDIAIKYVDEARVSNELVPIDLILKSYEECITWLSFGYDYEPEYYTVQEGDMIQGVAWLHSITTTNLVSVNADQLKTDTQVLQAGMELNVTPINSPIQVEVVKQRITVEPDYPEPTQYIYTDELLDGRTQTIQEYKEGSYRVLYEETYKNGELVQDATKEISRLQLEYPQQKIVKVGTYVIPSVGSGSFRYPVLNAYVTCDWGCYYGHTAVDFVNLYSPYDYVYAADRGVVSANGWNSIGGWYMIINHNNGLYSYYGHFSRRGFYEVGTIVDKGEIIGQIGMTGVASGPHVHFEVRVGDGSYGNAIYPWPYITGW